MGRYTYCFRFLHSPIYSFIPEFISRLPSITTLAPLTIPDLRRILTEVRGSLVSQYTALFGYSGVEIRFTSAALDQICHKASERGGGARGLRGIMVSIHYFVYMIPVQGLMCSLGSAAFGTDVRSSVSIGRPSSSLHLT